MKDFALILFMVLSICCTAAAGLSLLEGYGWEHALGFGVFAGLFFKIGKAFK